jgi:pimeloyl-ACP methyl ester carboxylesterase
LIGKYRGRTQLEAENMTQTRLLLLALMISMLMSGQTGSGTPADIVYIRPGQLVSVDGFRLNLYCMGSGSPAVIFDSGWEDWAPGWSKVQPQVAKWTRACSYDRAGVGFSEPGPMPRTSVRIADELHTALDHAGIRGPYILVAAAFGGDNMRVFADRYMPEIVGLVLVDADASDLEPAQMQDEEHRGEVKIVAQLRECRNAIAEHKPLPLLKSRPGQPQRTCAQQFFRGLPDSEWSPQLNAKLLDIAQTKVAMYDAFASEMEQVAADEAYLQQHRQSFGSRPIRVLTSRNHGVGHLENKPADTPEHLRYEQETTRAQARWLGLSSNAKQIFAHHSSEYIQLDEPETVVHAIRDVHDQAKRITGGPAEPAMQAAGPNSTCLLLANTTTTRTSPRSRRLLTGTAPAPSEMDPTLSGGGGRPPPHTYSLISKHNKQVNDERGEEWSCSARARYVQLRDEH